MALGAIDTDRLFSKLIAPAVRQSGFSPFRIDHSLNLRDLNLHIRESIEKSSIAIADLTYARPSVYYEAGYAERTMNVIYTVKADHLKQGAPPESSVHFDLKMKPLITWKHPLDEKFGNRLMRTLNKYGRPIFRVASDQQREADERRRFLAMSIAQRLSLLWTAYAATLRQNAFKLERNPDRAGELFWATRTSKQNIDLCCVLTGSALPISRIRKVKTFIDAYAQTVFGKHIDGHRGRPVSCTLMYVFCSLGGLRSTRVRELFPESQTATLPWNFEHVVSAIGNIRMRTRIHILDAVHSEAAVLDGVKQFSAGLVSS